MLLYVRFFVSNDRSNSSEDLEKVTLVNLGLIFFLNFAP